MSVNTFIIIHLIKLECLIFFLQSDPFLQEEEQISDDNQLADFFELEKHHIVLVAQSNYQ
jgi:hypothetical protein